MFGHFGKNSGIVSGPGLGIFDVFRTAGKVVEYAVTDQEKEGREKGKNVAAAIYAPVLRDLEDKQREIIAETDKYELDFETQVNLLRKQCEYYENGIVYYKHKINELAETTPGADKFFENVNDYGMYSGELSARNVSSAIYYSWSIADYLEKKMEEKREKFFKLEFERQSVIWQDKIKSIQDEILRLSNELRIFKSNNFGRLTTIKNAVDEAMKEYSEVYAEYNALKEMGK